MRRVIIESPYSGDVEQNTLYARRAMRDSLNRGEAPLASHLLYTQPHILDEDSPDEREWGIRAGYAWMEQADAVVIYFDRGISSGVRAAIEEASLLGKPIEFRQLPPTAEPPNTELPTTEASR